MLSIVRVGELLVCRPLCWSPCRSCVWPPHYKKPITYEEAKQGDEVLKGEPYKHLAYAPIRSSLPIHIYSLFTDPLLTKFISKATKKGFKALMRQLTDEMFAYMKCVQIDKHNEALKSGDKVHTECNPLKIFHTAIDNCTPLLITRPVKRGGAIYQVPYPLTQQMGQRIAMKWLIHGVRDRPRPRSTHFPEAMGKELIDAYYNEGRVVKKKQEMHRQCEANKAYAHYRWG